MVQYLLDIFCLYIGNIHRETSLFCIHFLYQDLVAVLISFAQNDRRGQSNYAAYRFGQQHGDDHLFVHAGDKAPEPLRAKAIAAVTPAGDIWLH